MIYKGFSKKQLYQVVVAASLGPLDGLEMLRREQPDLLLHWFYMDLWLNGYIRSS